MVHCDSIPSVDHGHMNPRVSGDWCFVEIITRGFRTIMPEMSKTALPKLHVLRYSPNKPFYLIIWSKSVFTLIQNSNTAEQIQVSSWFQRS